jgi:hypothetical protein
LEKSSEESVKYYDFDLAQKEQESTMLEMKSLEYYVPERSKLLLLLKIGGSLIGFAIALIAGYFIVDAMYHIMTPQNDWPLFVAVSSAFALIALVFLWFVFSGFRSLFSLEYRWEKLVITPDEIELFLDEKQKPIKIHQDEIDQLSVLFRYRPENSFRYNMKTDKLFVKIFLKNNKRYSLGAILRDLNQFTVKREHDILRNYLSAHFEISEKEMGRGDILFGFFVVIGIIVLVTGLILLGIYIARLV